VIKMEELRKVGFDEKMKRSATFVVENDRVKKIERRYGIKIMPIEEAIEEYGDFRINMRDRYTKLIKEKRQTGYFIRVPKGKKIMVPAQTLFLLDKENFNQILHNVVFLEENARLDMVSGCTSSPVKGLHASITQYFMKENSYLTYTMIHNWSKKMEVYPRSVAYLDRNATFISNYIALTPVKKIQSNPLAILKSGAVARFYSIIYAREGSNFDIGATSKLNEENAKSEIISRIISHNSRVVSRGLIEGNANKTKGHMECSGMVIEKGKIRTIPELKSGAENVDLSHEAAIGKIAEEELTYLMARGINEEEARSLLIRGFLDIQIKGLPPHITHSINRVIDMMTSSATI